MSHNTPLSSQDHEKSARNSCEPDSDAPVSKGVTPGEALDRLKLRKWFHLPRFNQRDGLDDYDGDYRSFDALGEVVTAHLRHRIQCMAEEIPDNCLPSTSGPHPETHASAESTGNQNRPGASGAKLPQALQADPDRENEGFQRLSAMLTRIRATVVGGAKEVCAIFSNDPISAASVGRMAEQMPEAVLAMGDHLPAAAGPEAWLGALAMGACRVILIGHEAAPAQQGQLCLAREILAGLHLDPGARLLSLAEAASGELTALAPAPAPLIPADWEPAGDERDLLWQAAAYLHSQVPGAPDHVRLEPGAPFGAVGLDASRCTLCMACVGACPTGALEHGSPGPRICFMEQDCTQCGRCRQVCPEQAVTLTPRICFDSRLTGNSRILHQEAPLRCSICGAPYATAGVVAAVSRKLAAHWMYQDPSARERLTMCRDCRIRSYYASPHQLSPRRPAGRKK